MVRANTILVVVHQPAVTCRSTPEFPCWIVLETPKGYTLFSGGALVTDLPCSVWPLSSTTCDAWARSCTFFVTPGETLWANVQYCAYDSVQNSLSPMSASENNWTVRVSGSGGWTYP